METQFEQNLFPVKLMIIMVCNLQGVLMCHPFPQGKIVNAWHYMLFP